METLFFSSLISFILLQHHEQLVGVDLSGRGVNGTGVRSVLELNVTSLSPASSPLVTEVPRVGVSVSIGGPSGQLDAMINRCSTGLGRDDTAVV